jgi:transcriptional regulator with XRE-family HTH domain
MAFKNRPGILELARITGISPSHVSKVFGGTRRPSLNTAALLAEAAGITLDTLYVELKQISRAA